MKKQSSLGDIALEFGVKKSRFSYYTKIGLLKPISTIGGMHIFEYKSTCERLKKILSLQKAGHSLREIKLLLK